MIGESNCFVRRGSYRKGDSLARFTDGKITNHGSQISKFHFPESDENKQLICSLHPVLTQKKGQKYRVFEESKTREGRRKPAFYKLHTFLLSFYVFMLGHRSRRIIYQIHFHKNESGTHESMGSAVSK